MQQALDSSVVTELSRTEHDPEPEVRRRVPHDDAGMPVVDDLETSTGNPLAIWGPLAAYLIAIAAAELLLALRYPELGIGLHLVLLFLLPVHEAFAPRLQAPLLVALVFAPLLRAISLALPLVGWDIIYWYLATSLPLFVGMLMATRALGLSRRQLGMRFGNPLTQLGIALFGLPLGLCEYLILRPEPLLRELTPQSFIVPALILLVSTGFLEEILFRGLLQVSALRAVGMGGLVYVSAIFAVLHIGHLSTVDVVFVFLVGLAFGWLVRRTGSLFGVTLAHGATNIGLFLVFPILALGSQAVAPTEPVAASAPAATVEASGQSVRFASDAVVDVARITPNALLQPTAAPTSIPTVVSTVTATATQEAIQPTAVPTATPVLTDLASVASPAVTPPTEAVLLPTEAGPAQIVAAPLATESDAPAQTDQPAGGPAPADAEATEPRTYTVVPGDTLFLIARAVGTSVGQLARDNGLRNPYLIYPGQSLRIAAP
jgi:membrane protease YdiL (CAAX protease family)/LysM repeat protein